MYNSVQSKSKIPEAIFEKSNFFFPVKISFYSVVIVSHYK